MSPDRLRQAALVSGAGSGIGRAVALDLAASGLFVGCGDIRGSADTVRETTDRGGEGVAFALDVSVAASWESAVATLTTGAPLAMVALVAGRLAPGSDRITEIDKEGWDAVVATNLKGVWLGIRASAAASDGHGGSIVTVGSVAAVKGISGLAAYTASKSGVIGLTRAAAVELASNGLRINCVVPGRVRAPMLTSREVSRGADSVTVPECDPEDVASVVTFLLSDRARFINGQAIVVDGGWTIGVDKNLPPRRPSDTATRERPDA